MQIFQIIAESIFFSLKIIIPVFFIVSVCNMNLRRLEMLILIKALNYTLLLASGFYLVEILCEIINDQYVDTARWHTTTIQRAIGPYWFGFWLPVAINIFLPQLIWLKKVRNLVKLLYIWFVVATTFSIFLKFVIIEMMFKREIPLFGVSPIWINYDFLPPLSYCSWSLISTSALVLIIYFVLTKRVKVTKEKINNNNGYA